MTTGKEDALLARISVDPTIFGGKPIVGGRRLAVEHVLGMLAAGDTADDLLRDTRGSNATTCRPVWCTPAAWLVTNGSNPPSRAPTCEGSARQLYCRFCGSRAECCGTRC